MASRHLTAAFVALIAALAPAGTAHAAVGPQQVEALDRQGATEIIVRREPGLSAAERADVRADADVELTRRSTLPDTELVEAGKGDLAEAVAALNRDPDVIYAEPVTVQSALSADPSYSSLWGLDNTGQRLYPPSGGGYYNGGTPDADMDVAEAWTKASGTGVSVAIVDTGVLTTHPDLADQIATNPGEIGTDALNRDKRSNGVDDDGNGYKDDWQGWDFVAEYPSIGVSEGDSTPGPDNVPQDNHGHGTHVAGTVAAERDNNEGIAGVAPGARIVPLRALGATGTGSSLGIAEAFDYAGKLGVRVVNASLGGPGLNQSQLSAIQAHPNTLYVIAAGNDNVNVDSTPYGPCALPAANVLCVGASDFNDAKASFSNYGAQGVDVFAPGTMILSTYTSSAYAYLQGTSMASPNTAGVAALVLSARPGASALDIKSAIMASTDAKPDLMGKAVTGGRVNADRAVTGAHRRRPGQPDRAGDHRHAAPGQPAGRVVGHLGPARHVVRLRLAALLRQRLDLDDDRRRHRQHLHPRRIGHRRARARHRHRHQPVRRRQLDLGRGRPGPLGRAGQHRAAGHQRHAAPRPDAHRHLGLEPDRDVLRVPVAALDRRRHLDEHRHQRRHLRAHDRRAGCPHPRHGHRHQRLRAGLGDQRPGRARGLGPARQHGTAGDHRHLAADLHADRGHRLLGRLGQHLPLPVAARRRQRLDADQRRDRGDLPARQGRRGRARAGGRHGHQRRRHRRARERPDVHARVPVPARQHRRADAQRHAAAHARR